MSVSPLIGVGAGLASAVMFVAAISGGALGAFLPFLSSLPIVIAGLGWSWLTALLSSVVSAAGLALVANPSAALLHALPFSVPMVAAVYFLSLKRQLTADDGSVWIQDYPVGYVLAGLGIFAGLLSAAAIAAMSEIFDVEAYRRTLAGLQAEFVDVMTEVSPDIADRLDADAQKALVDMAYVYLPGSMGIWFLMVLAFNLWLGAAVTAKSSRLDRPWPNFSALVLPRTFPIAFVIAAGASFLPGMVGLVASGFASAIVIVYALIGLGIVQQATKAWSLGFVVRGLAMLSLILLTRIASLILATLALAEPYAPWRRTIREDEPRPAHPNSPGATGSGSGPQPPDGRT